MKTVLARILTLLFTSLSLLHFYWAFGGKWAFEKVLPTNSDGLKLLSPTTTDSVIVGLGLLFFSLFYLFTFKTLKNKYLRLLKNIGSWAIPILFLVRAVGDFKYLGFFKEVHGTEFAQLDTMLYSPLCLAVSLIGITLIKLK